MANKTYLGDGAYATLEDWGAIAITAENGIFATDRVELGPVEIRALLKFIAAGPLYPVLDEIARTVNDG